MILKRVIRRVTFVTTLSFAVSVALISALLAAGMYPFYALFQPNEPDVKTL